MSILSRSNNWDAEYNHKGIPSSFRTEPSGSVVTFLSLLEELGFSGKAAIDIGCGTGRNSLALARAGYEVTAFDFAPGVVDQFTKELDGSEFQEQVSALCHDVTKPWPLPDNSVSVAIDTFCFKHQIPMEHRLIYLEELNRTVKLGGMFLLTLADIEDGYYKQFLKPDLGENVIVDPENDIPSVLYSKDDVLCFFKGFELVEYIEKRKPSKMHGENFDRVTHLLILKRDSH